MAEENNNVESLTYKITVDTSEIDNATEKVRKFSEVNREAQADSKKPITPTVNVEKLNEGTKVISNTKKAADELTESIKKMNQATDNSGMNKIINTTQKVNTEIAKAKMSFKEFAEVIENFDKKSVSEVAKRIDTFLGSHKGNVSSQIKSIKESMNLAEESGFVTKDSDAWHKFQRDLVIKFAKEVERLGGSFNTLLGETKKPVEVKTNTQPVKQLTTEATKTKQAVDGLAQSIKKLDATSSGKNGIGKVTNDVKNLGNQAQKTEALISRETFRKDLENMDNAGLNKVAEAVNNHFRSRYVMDDIDGKTPVDNVMGQYGDFELGSKEYYNAKRQALRGLVEQVYMDGGDFGSLDKANAKALEAQAGAMKKVATNASQANSTLKETGKTVGTLNRELTNRELGELKRLARENPAAFNKIASELMGKNVNIGWEDYKERHKEGRRARGNPIADTPENQRRAETRQAIRDVQRENKNRDENAQRANRTVEDFKAKQAETRSILSRLTHRSVTNKGIDRALEDVEKEFGKKLPELKQSVARYFEPYANIPKENTFERAQFLEKFNERVNNPLKYAKTTEVLSEITSEKVTSATKDKTFSELEAKLGKDKLGEGYFNKRPKERALYLLDAFEKEKEAAEASAKAVKSTTKTKVDEVEKATKAIEQESNKKIQDSINVAQTAAEKKVKAVETAAKQIQKVEQDTAEAQKEVATKKAKAQTTEQAKKSAVEEADAENKQAKAATQSADRIEKAETKKRNARNKTSDGTKKAITEEVNAEKRAEQAAEARRRRIAQLQERADKIASDFDSNLKSAPRGGNPKGAETYDKLQKRERKILDELNSLGVKRESALFPTFEEYTKFFNANSSKAKAAEAKAAMQEQAKLQREAAAQAKAQAKEQANAEKAAVNQAKAIEKAKAAYGKLQDRYVKSISGGKEMTPNQFAEMQKQAEKLANTLKSQEGFTPFQMEKSYDAYQKVSQIAQTRVRATRELEKAENNLMSVYSRQNSLITRGKQLTEDQYQTIKKAGEEALQRAKAAGSQMDIAMPFNTQKYDDVAKFNREAIIKNAMSWNNQGVDSYSNSINRLLHAQEALFSAYQRDPHPKYLQMLSKTRAELSRVTNEYKEYQRQVNDTGTTMDKFMGRARSHLEWIASGVALSVIGGIPIMYSETLENLEAKMAGIKQVIPMIEGLEDSAKFGTKEEQIARAKKETEDLIGIAAQYGATVDEVMEAARSIGRMYGQGESGVINTNIMTAQATRMAVADAFDVLDATRGLESAMSQWNLQTEDSQQLIVNTNRILDVWTKTAHRGAASAQDIADAIQLAGTAAYQAGVSFEFFNALVAAGVRATARSGNEIGTSIKSMMVSMQTPKAEKALKEWGISLKEIGTDGQLHMRNLEDVILDVAMAVQSTEKDTTDLFLALSGGKFQYSKVSAMLKNGTELIRMLTEIHAPDTVGFTGQQIEVQLDTLTRKIATVKDDLQGMVFNIGGIEVMKDFLDAVDNLTVGMSKLSQMFGGQVLTVVKYTAEIYAFIRAGRKLAYMLGTVYQSFKILQAAQVATVGSSVGVKAAFVNETRALAAARMARLGYVITEKQGTVSTNTNTVATKANATAHVGNTEALTAETMAWMRYGVVQKGGALQTAMSTARAASAMSGLSRGAQIAGGAIGALGGPVGIIIGLLTILIPIIYEWASAVGEAENKMRKNIETHQEHLAQVEQSIQKVSQTAENMKKLAKQYDKIHDSLAECTEGTKEYNVKQEQLKDIKKALMNVIEDETALIEENGHININTINEWEKRSHEVHLEKLNEEAEQAKQHKETTTQRIEDTKKRIKALELEVIALEKTGHTLDWFTKTSANAQLSIGKFLKDAGIANNWQSFVEQGQAMINSAEHVLVGQNGSGDVESAKEILQQTQEELKKLQEEERDLTMTIFTADELNNRVKNDNNVANNPEERGTIDEDEEGSKGGRGSGGSSSGGKSRLPYESDELAAAIHEAAQSSYAKDNGLSEPLLRAIAQQQSGLSQEFAEGNKIGAFAVTEEMGRRFGQDVTTPIGNAMTAVLTLTQKISDAGGDVGAAINSFTGGKVGAVYAESKAQQDAYTFDGSDYFGSSDFGADVIAAARQRLGLPYGGSDLSDEFQAVCTTFVQRALVDAGADESIVRSLTADANNWAQNAGAAFHPYGDGYAPKPGDIALTNIDESGHSGHVNLIDENGTGYYSAGGSAGVSAHYDTPVEVAYEDDIEGYIDIAALTGKSRGTGLRSKGSNVRKSVFDFRRSSYEQLMYQIQKAKEDYEDEAKDIDLERAMTGDSYELAAREQLNEQAKLTVEQNSLKLLERMYNGVQKSIENTIKNAPDLQVALGQEGAKWTDLVPEEKKQLASLYKNDNGVFAELVNEEIKLHDALREQAKVVKEQTKKANKYLHMSIEEAAEFENDRLKMKYENFEAGLPDDNESLYLNHVKSNRAKQEMLRGQITNQTTVRDYAYNQYTQSVMDDQKEMTKVQAKIQAAKEHLALLRQEAEGGRDVTSAVQAQEQELTNLIASYDVLSRVGSPQTVRLEKAFYKADTAVKQLQKDLDKVAKQDLQNVRNYGAQMFTDLIVEGKSFKDVWKSLWKDLARYTINAMFGVSNSGNIWSSILSIFGGGKADGGAFARGGRIPGYAQGGGMIKGAGTGTSDSILAYLANKDKFVYLSNGEYVMTAEATKRIGQENLDALNGYADGGAIAPTPYVPTLSQRASRRIGTLSNRNPNARMEQLMQEQTSVIQGMSNGGNGQIVVLNTKASSSDVLRAMQENPRQVQAILGQQRRAGFK